MKLLRQLLSPILYTAAGVVATLIFMLGSSPPADCPNPIESVASEAAPVPLSPADPVAAVPVVPPSALESRYALLGAVVDSTRGSKAWIENIAGATSAQYREGEKLDEFYSIVSVQPDSVLLQSADGQSEILRLRSRQTAADSQRRIDSQPSTGALASRDARRENILLSPRLPLLNTKRGLRQDREPRRQRSGKRPRLEEVEPIADSDTEPETVEEIDTIAEETTTP